MTQPFALIILDGWGYREEKKANAIAEAHTPCWDALWQKHPHCLIQGSGPYVGLPEGQMGNSEVGHLHMGAGRRIYQDLTRIDLSIKDKTFFLNPALCEAIDHAVSSNKAIHVLCLLSAGGVHSHESHLHALIQLAAMHHASEVYIHAFLDGRDTPPKSATTSLMSLENQCKEVGSGQIASLIGRYYAMDRDNRWERVEKAWQLLVMGNSDFTAITAQEGLLNAYRRNETDEFVSSTRINNSPPLHDGDTVIFMNFRADRARELTLALTQASFTGFARPLFPKVHFATLTEYDATYTLPTAFTSEPLRNMLGDYLSHLNRRQLRLAETEKYAHVTFFFNGGIETPFEGEDRILIPSPKVATYDLAPAMSAEKVTDALINAIVEQRHDLIVCNFANPDMVGHTGNILATRQAIETIDHCLERITQALNQFGGEALITSDHGNAELMLDLTTGEPHTAHTQQPVPLLYVGRPATLTPAAEIGTLADIAPTVLYFLNLPQPPEMTGHPLFKLNLCTETLKKE